LLRLRTGKSVVVRFVEPRDADALQDYFRSALVRSRYNRFLGAMSELPQTSSIISSCRRGGRFHHDATMPIDGIVETIVGEARYAFDAIPQVFEFGCRSTTAGKARASVRHCSKTSLGRSVRRTTFGDTLPSNDVFDNADRRPGLASGRRSTPNSKLEVSASNA